MIIVHEFEGLLFSNPYLFNHYFDIPDIGEKLAKIREDFESPEHIDNGQHTAPSKRILANCKEYDKILHGSLIAIEIGIDRIRKECSFFNHWMARLESLSPPSI
jgi:hypothetical protein